MNKLLGFYELKDSGLPSVPWIEFNLDLELDRDLLWTVRTAIDYGDDFNLPRKVGVDSTEAYITASYFHKILGNKGIVVVYPYFIAEKSGTLEINCDRLVIEAVDKDLWNLVTENKKNVTIYESSEKSFIDGDKNFLLPEEYNELKKQSERARRIFRTYLLEGKSILLEWSFAYNTDIKKRIIGNKYLVFYEARTI